MKKHKARVTVENLTTGKKIEMVATIIPDYIATGKVPDENEELEEGTYQLHMETLDGKAMINGESLEATLINSMIQGFYDVSEQADFTAKITEIKKSELDKQVYRQRGHTMGEDEA